MLSQMHKNLIDAKLVLSDPFNEKNKTPLKILIDRYGEENIISSIVKEEDHLLYKYLPSLDGWSSAWLRVPWILESNSILFL